MDEVFEDLEAQVAVITGGARGLGLSMAEALAKWGTKIALLDVLRDVTHSAGTVQREFAVESVGVVADVTDESSVAAAFADVGRALGSPSILINAAGITVWEDSIDVSRVLAAGDQHQFDGYVPVLSGARAGLRCSWQGRRDRQRLVNVGASCEPSPTSSVVSRI